MLEKFDKQYLRIAQIWSENLVVKYKYYILVEKF